MLPTEDPAEFEALHAGLHDDRKPQGDLEYQLVSRIAICTWRLFRIARVENGFLDLAAVLKPEEQAFFDRVFGTEPTHRLQSALLAFAFSNQMGSTDNLMRICRYETMLGNQLKRAIADLERTQANRRRNPNQNCEAPAADSEIAQPPATPVAIIPEEPAAKPDEPEEISVRPPVAETATAPISGAQVTDSDTVARVYSTPATEITKQTQLPLSAPPITCNLVPFSKQTQPPVPAPPLIDNP